MPSSALRLRDLRGIHSLAHECRDLGDDAARWREHLFAGLCRLTGADIGMGGEMGGCRAGRLQNLGIADWGWEGGFDRAGWLRAVGQVARNPTGSNLLVHYMPRLAASDGVCLSRRDYISDEDWYRGDEYQVSYTTAGLDMSLICFRELSGRADEFSGLILSRARGARDFTGRDRAVLAEAHAAVGPLVGGPLARFADPSPAALPPRVRRVLKCLLEGDSDKQIAARLGISKYTVNQYVQHVFAHFGVNTRAELLARWVRRGWGGRAAWADD